MKEYLSGIQVGESNMKYNVELLIKVSRIEFFGFCVFF